MKVKLKKLPDCDAKSRCEHCKIGLEGKWEHNGFYGRNVFYYNERSKSGCAFCIFIEESDIEEIKDEVREVRIEKNFSS